MKRNKLILGCSYGDWQEEVNNYLKDGWVVVPGTITMAGWQANGFSQERYALVVERVGN